MTQDFAAAAAAYDADRAAAPGEPFCHAPFVNLHFSHGGSALACCHNRTYTLGTYPEQSVAEIWNGGQVRELRAAMAGYNLSKGCQLCARQLLAGDLVGLRDTAGSYTDASAKAFWQQGDRTTDPFARAPRKLEFEIHNSCNLECVMCHGAASSSIRKFRDGLPPLPTPYDDAFVDQLAPFLPEVREAGFTGGEPFLIPLYYRIWERIAAVNPGMMLLLVTNGTVLNDRVRRLVEDLDFIINVSVDSIVPGTYESIRKGSSLQTVLDNSRYFAEVMARKGRPFIWRCCVMRQNWAEMPDMVRFCDDHGIRIVFNQIDFPLDFSLHTLPPQDLRAVVGALQAADTFSGDSAVQQFNHQQYRGLVGRLAAFIEREHWQAALQDRLENARANPMLHGWSTKGMRLYDDPAADQLAELVSMFVATRLTVQQAQDARAEAVPAAALDAVAQLRAAVSGRRASLPAEVFLAVLLNVAARTFIKIRGVASGHHVSVFDRIRPVITAALAESDQDRAIDQMIDCPPAALYDHLASGAPLHLQVRG